MAPFLTSSHDSIVSWYYLTKLNEKRNLVFSTYLTLNRKVYNGPVPKIDDFSYIERWLASAYCHGLPVVLLYDQLSPEFISRYSSDLIHFVESPPLFQNRTPNDRRFLLYKHLLFDEPREPFSAASHYIFTDAKDVIFLKNIFEFIRDHESNQTRIFCGNDAPASSKGFQVTIYRCLSAELFELTGEHPSYNAGFLGGSRQVIQQVLDRISLLLSIVNSRKNCNMGVFNLAIRQLFQRDQIISRGQMINGFFNSVHPGTFVAHKPHGNVVWEDCRLKRLD